ncbi:DNA-binding XRE family transcriptional regulator [Thermolongibacillus altinsuensis]|uniref:DNA-binding XRE family transcriptional regulator n=1 Tax=Thermolongibacillus altinsuensis TaxID=575256 RepID=A0A4R1QHD9_9BACL|nr:helix-turn-helix transcriptional regulator [Thermolongibacillus altinsuensis]TCL51088.1 DNA-binding XRE family transcriptional regulator [Thermolongibacillus altinsuensis]
MRNINDRDKVLKIIGNNIRSIRTCLNLSQEELAFKSGLHRTYIGAVERGEKNITILNLIKIANALEVRVQDLLDLDKEEDK